MALGCGAFNSGIGLAVVCFGFRASGFGAKGSGLKSMAVRLKVLGLGLHVPRWVGSQMGSFIWVVVKIMVPFGEP